MFGIPSELKVLFNEEERVCQHPISSRWVDRHVPQHKRSSTPNASEMRASDFELSLASAEERYKYRLTYLDSSHGTSVTSHL